MSRTWIVVPCYNEADRLVAAAFEAELDRRPELTFLFVNDGSRDATAGILNGIARRHVRAEALHLERNGGKAEAVRQLAYRLYTLCERLGQAEDARAYNELITSWTGIESAATREAKPAGRQGTLFEE